MPSGKVTYTLILGTGAILINTGTYIAAMDQFCDYAEITSKNDRSTIIALTFFSSVSMIALTRCIALYEDYDAGGLEFLTLFTASDQSRFARAMLWIMAINACYMSLFYGQLSSNALLTTVDANNSLAGTIVFGVFITVTDILSFGAFLLKKAMKNIQAAEVLWHDYLEGNDHLNNQALIKAIATSAITIIANMIFINFTMQLAIESFPGITQIQNSIATEIFAGLAAFTQAPVLSAIYFLQSYLYYSSNDNELSYLTNISSTRLPNLLYASFLVIACIYLLMFGSVGYISSIALLAQFGLLASSTAAKAIATIPTLSFCASEYIFMVREAAKNMTKLIDHALSSDSETNSNIRSQSTGRGPGAQLNEFTANAETSNILHDTQAEGVEAYGQAESNTPYQRIAERENKTNATTLPNAEFASNQDSASYWMRLWNRYISRTQTPFVSTQTNMALN